jgi:tRNA A-37 threonylcarbamoyl transferase component Bud32
VNSLLGKCIGSGNCSEVFEWGDDKAIKLFRSNTNEYAVNREYNNMIVAWKSGLPTYRPYEKVELEGRLGIIYEKINGQTLMDRFLQWNIAPNNITFPINNNDKLLIDYKDNDIRITAKVLNDIHQKRISGMPNQEEMIKNRISRAAYLTQEEKQCICRIVDNLPSKDLLCHGDPNPGNFIIRDDKLFIIDWMNATIGNPAADIAEYIIMIRYAVLPTEIPNSFCNFFNAIRELVIQTFLDEYIKLSNMEYGEIEQWMLPVMAGKLSDDAISDKEKKILVEEVRKKL